jgi:hypothetical protein
MACAKAHMQDAMISKGVMVRNGITQALTAPKNCLFEPSASNALIGLAELKDQFVKVSRKCEVINGAFDEKRRENWRRSLLQYGCV